MRSIVGEVSDKRRKDNERVNYLLKYIFTAPQSESKRGRTRVHWPFIASDSCSSRTKQEFLLISILTSNSKLNLHPNFNPN